MALLHERFYSPRLTSLPMMKHILSDDPAPDDCTYFPPHVERDSHVTRSQTDDAQERQDKAIRDHFTRLESRLEDWNEDIVHSFGRIETGQEKLGQRLNITEQGLSEVRWMCQLISSQMKDLTASNSNQRAYKARDPVVPLSVEGRLPRRFPSTVAQFWQLQFRKNHHVLQYLVQFYGCDYPSYYMSNDPSDGEDGASSEEEVESISIRNEAADERLTDQQLETLIQNQASSVLECLAGKLGLDYPSIRSRLSPSVLGKRRSDSKSHGLVTWHEDDPRKRQKRQSDAQEGTQVAEIMTAPPATLNMNSFMQQLIKNPENYSHTSAKSSEGHVSWAGPNDPRWTDKIASRSSPNTTLRLSSVSDQDSERSGRQDAGSVCSTDRDCL